MGGEVCIPHLLHTVDNTPLLGFWDTHHIYWMAIDKMFTKIPWDGSAGQWFLHSLEFAGPLTSDQWPYWVMR